MNIPSSHRFDGASPEAVILLIRDSLLSAARAITHLNSDEPAALEQFDRLSEKAARENLNINPPVSNRQRKYEHHPLTEPPSTKPFSPPGKRARAENSKAWRPRWMARSSAAWTTFGLRLKPE